MKKILFAFLVLIFVSCGSGRVATTNTKPTETIVFGKLTIKSNTPLDNKKIVMHFNERLWGKNAVWLDENGYFYLKMPLGNNFIALLEYRKNIGYYKNIPDNYISINVPLSDKVYYVGDIVINWTPSKSDERKTGAAGVISDANKKGEKIKTTIQNSEKTIDYFKQLFPSNEKEIITQLAEIQ